MKCNRDKNLDPNADQKEIAPQKKRINYNIKYREGCLDSVRRREPGFFSLQGLQQLLPPPRALGSGTGFGGRLLDYRIPMSGWVHLERGWESKGE